MAKKDIGDLVIYEETLESDTEVDCEQEHEEQFNLEEAKSEEVVEGGPEEDSVKTNISRLQALFSLQINASFVDNELSMYS